jgi:hypothetical protein
MEEMEMREIKREMLKRKRGKKKEEYNQHFVVRRKT